MTLRLVKMELREIKIPFRFSFKHSLATRSAANNLLVILTADSGATGFGEVLPREYLTGESLSSCWEDLRTRWWPRLKELKFLESDSPLPTLRPLYLEADSERKTASYAGLDIAACDAWGRATGTPLQKLFGAAAFPVRLSAPLGAGKVSSVKLLALIFKLLGFREFKLKVDGNNIVPLVTAVRNIIGYNCSLRLDANAAWNLPEALALAQFLQEMNISSVEQPFPVGNNSELASLRNSGVRVMADESLCALADARELLSRSCADLWNLRLAKVGGFSGVRELAELGKRHGVKFQSGVLVGETSLLAAAQRCCLGLAEWEHVEYGFPKVLLKRDPFRGGPGGYLGSGHACPERPGLGVEPVQKILSRITVRREVFD
jgi:L-alanine-DL-glutamate epimerase-like enolase superfamily enzyme